MKKVILNELKKIQEIEITDLISKVRKTIDKYIKTKGFLFHKNELKIDTEKGLILLEVKKNKNVWYIV